MSIRNMAANASMTSDPYTFTPAISDASKVLAEQQDLYKGDFKDFQTRQVEFLMR
jgi:hypothetical protein